MAKEMIFNSKMNYKVCKDMRYGCPYHSCLGNFCQYEVMEHENRQWLRSCKPDIRDTAAGEIIFVKYSASDRCNKCILMHYPHECKKIECTADERTDNITGYFRLFRAKARDEHSMPKPTKLMMILVIAGLLVTSCTINMKVTVEHKIETPEAAKDSASVNIETIWY
jgi:hypothetical protein